MARCKHCGQKMKTFSNGPEGYGDTYQTCRTPGCPGGNTHHHTNTFGNSGGRHSWDHDQFGNITKNHFTDQGYPKGNLGSHPFDKKKKNRF